MERRPAPEEEVKMMSRNRSGFSLVEVLVALGILAIILPTVLTVTASMSNTNAVARLRVQAAVLAERETERLLSNAAVPLSGNEPPFSWVSTVQAGSLPDLTEITVTVSFDYNGRTYSLPVVTYGR
jgi:prepilin-type N-terminal cleavage/methylation domain-containing protein